MQGQTPTGNSRTAAITGLALVVVAVVAFIQTTRVNKLQGALTSEIAGVSATTQVQLGAAEATTQVQVASIQATAVAQRLDLDTARNDFQNEIASTQASIDQAQLALEQRRFDAEQQARRDSVVKECVPQLLSQ